MSIFIPKLRLILILNSFLGSSDSLVFSELFHSLAPRPLAARSISLDAINNVFRKFSAFHDETGRLNVDGMNIISNDGSNKLNRSRKARVSYKVQRTINASLNAATSTRAVSSNPNFVTRQKIEIIFG